MNSPKTLEQFKKLLLNRKKDLLSLSNQSVSAQSIVNLDQGVIGRLSRMDAIRAQAMAVETENRRQTEISRIEIALSRISEQTYGLCISCEENIEQKRLQNDPAVAICINCAKHT